MNTKTSPSQSWVSIHSSYMCIITTWCKLHIHVPATTRFVYFVCPPPLKRTLKISDAWPGCMLQIFRSHSFWPETLYTSNLQQQKNIIPISMSSNSIYELEWLGQRNETNIMTQLDIRITMSLWHLHDVIPGLTASLALRVPKVYCGSGVCNVHPFDYFIAAAENDVTVDRHITVHQTHNAPRNVLYLCKATDKRIIISETYESKISFTLCTCWWLDNGRFLYARWSTIQEGKEKQKR